MTKDEFEKNIRNYLILAIPLAFFILIISEFSFFDPWNVLLLKVYAIFLCVQLLYVLYTEYIFFNELHRHKSPVVDLLLIAGIFVSIRLFSKNAAEIPLLLLWLALTLALMSVWEIFTMTCGYKVYFSENRDSKKISSLIKHLIKTITYKFDKNDLTHWDEYRYWLASDSILCVLTFLGYIFSPQLQSLLPDSAIQLSIAALAFYIGIFNMWRYRLVILKEKK